MTNFIDSSKLKEFAVDNFKFDVNGRKLSKWVENTVGKGEIARDKQFLLFPLCFQKACFPEASKGVIVWEWVKFVSEHVETLEKEENSGNQHFLLFPQWFNPLPHNAIFLLSKDI